MAKTTSIFDAIVLDLKAINGTGIFATTVAQVYTESADTEVSKNPSITVWQNGLDVPADEIGLSDAHAFQVFRFLMHVKSITYLADLRAFQDDVRNAIERDVSNIHGVDRVEVAMVTRIDPPSATSQDISDGRVFQQGEIVVNYHYQRGVA